MASVTSSCSVESDWSDEEIEELEKMFGHIQVTCTFYIFGVVSIGVFSSHFVHFRTMEYVRTY